LSGDLNRPPMSKLEGHTNRVSSLSYFPKKNMLASSGQDGTVRVWVMSSGSHHQFLQQTLVFQRADDEDNSEQNGYMLNLVAWNSNGKLLAGAVDEMVNIWHLSGGKGHLDLQPYLVTALTWPQNKGLMEGQNDRSCDTLLIGRLDGSIGMVEVIDSTTYARKELEHCYRKDVSVRHIEWYDEDKRFAVGYSDGMVYLCSPDEYQQPIAIEAHQRAVSNLKWDPSGQLLMTCAGETQVKMWLHERDTWMCHQHLSHSSAIVTTEWCNIIGKRHVHMLMLACGAIDGSISVWRLPVPSPNNSLPVHSKFSRNYARLVDGEHEEATLVMKCLGHISAVTSLCFSPSGLMLVSGCTKGWFNIWALQDGSLLHTVTGQGPVTGVSWYAEHGVAVSFGRSKDIQLVHCSLDFYHKNKVVACCRKSLRKLGLAGLNTAPCLKAFLTRLPFLLQEQYLYEKPLVSSGEQLVHSQYLQCLASLAVGLGLDNVLCHLARPPHSNSGTHGLVPEWYWLHTFGIALRTAHALAHRHAFPATFVELASCSQDASPGQMLEAHPDPFDNSKWDLKVDEEIMRWATQRPEDWQHGGKCDAYLWGGGRHGQLCETGR